jgi:rhodanese-related sulfurtransferase
MPVASSHASVPVVDRQTLRERLARGEVKLIMAGSDFAFRAKHIPGSLHFPTLAAMFAALRTDEDLVVYCSNLDCHASIALIEHLRERGYQRVSHYAGGLLDWEAAGLPLEGEWATQGAS